MFLACKPSEQVIREFLLRQTNQDLSYGEAGLSQRRAAAGYIRDHNRTQLGTGAIPEGSLGGSALADVSYELGAALLAGD